MSEATDVFWAKTKEREALGERIDSQVNALLEILEQFSGSRTRYGSGKSWQWIQIFNGGTIPSHIAESSLSFDLNDWPDIRELTSLISKWHSLDSDYRQAWLKMTAQEKEQLAAHKPEEYSTPSRY